MGSAVITFVTLCWSGRPHNALAFVTACQGSLVGRLHLHIPGGTLQAARRSEKTPMLYIGMGAAVISIVTPSLPGKPHLRNAVTSGGNGCLQVASCGHQVESRPVWCCDGPATGWALWSSSPPASPIGVRWHLARCL